MSTRLATEVGKKMKAETLATKVVSTKMDKLLKKVEKQSRGAENELDSRLKELEEVAKANAKRMK